MCDFSIAIDKSDNIFITTSGGISFADEDIMGKSKITKLSNDGEIQWEEEQILTFRGYSMNGL